MLGDSSKEYIKSLILQALPSNVLRVLIRTSATKRDEQRKHPANTSSSLSSWGEHEHTFVQLFPRPEKSVIVGVSVPLTLNVCPSATIFIPWTPSTVEGTRATMSPQESPEKKNIEIDNNSLLGSWKIPLVSPIYLPWTCSQWAPVKPAVQPHLYCCGFPNTGRHVPPFWHGDDSQGLCRNITTSTKCSWSPFNRLPKFTSRLTSAHTQRQ